MKGGVGGVSDGVFGHKGIKVFVSLMYINLKFSNY